MFKRVVATGVGVAMSASAMAACSSSPEKQVAPEFQTALMANEAHNNLLNEITAHTPVSTLLGACAVKSFPEKGLSVVVINPLFGEVSSIYGNSTEVVRAFGFIAELSKDKVGVGSLGADYTYTANGKHTSNGIVGKNFHVVELPGKRLHEEKLIPESSVLSGIQTPPKTMTLNAGNMSVGTTFYRQETPQSRAGIIDLCTNAQSQGTNLPTESFGTIQAV